MYLEKKSELKNKELLSLLNKSPINQILEPVIVSYTFNGNKILEKKIYLFSEKLNKINIKNERLDKITNHTIMITDKEVSSFKMISYLINLTLHV